MGMRAAPPIYRADGTTDIMYLLRTTNISCLTAFRKNGIEKCNCERKNRKLKLLNRSSSWKAARLYQIIKLFKENFQLPRNRNCGYHEEVMVENPKIVIVRVAASSA